MSTVAIALVPDTQLQEQALKINHRPSSLRPRDGSIVTLVPIAPDGSMALFGSFCSGNESVSSGTRLNAH